MARLDAWFDPELEELFREDPSLLETAHLVRSSRPAAPDDRGFQRRLRAELMAEAQRTLAPRRRRRFALRLGFGHLAFGGAALGTALVAATVFALVSHRVQDHQATITVSSNVAAQHAVSPNDVITVAFNQPMDEQAVVQGLSIRPATQVTTAWQGNNLVITPTHHLAGNTPYTVTIAQGSLQTASGVKASAPVEIAFGTAPTPAPVVQPPSLAPLTLGPASSGATVVFSPGGGVVVTDGQIGAGAASPGSTPGSTPAATNSPEATASPSASSSASATPAASPVTGLVEYPASGQQSRLGPAATAAAFSPNGSTLATAIPDGNGGSDLVVSGADGSSPHTLIDSPNPILGLTWVSNGRLAFASATTVLSIDLAGVAGTSATAPSSYGPLGSLAPGGAYAFLTAGPGGSGGLLRVADGSVQPLPGSSSIAAFSADGATIAWVDSAGQAQRVDVESVGTGVQSQVATLSPGAAVTGLSLSGDGRTLAYVQGSGSSAQLVLASLPTGAPIAVGPAPLALAFSPQGDAIALVVSTPAGPVAERAPVPGATTHLHTALPPGAEQVLNSFVAAQVSGNATAMQQLSAASLNAARLTPPGLSRAYQISTAAAADGSVRAMVELIVDPSATQPTARVADETLRLDPAGGAGQYVVSKLSIGQLHDQSSGPHVVSVSSAPGSDGSTVLSLSFDSDLAPSTVQAAIAVVAGGQNLTPTDVSYDADSRTLTVTVDAGSASAVELTVGQALQDVDGNSLAAPFTTTFGTS